MLYSNKYVFGFNKKWDSRKQTDNGLITFIDIY